MPEDNQIQSGFQPENQANPHPQIQQNNFVQGEQVPGATQQVNQQNNIKVPQQNLSQDSKTHKSWLTKILIGISFLIGFGLIGLGIHDYFEISSSWWYYYSDSIRNIILNNGTWAFFLAGILFITFGTIKLFHDKKSHTSWLVKIVSRILYFLGLGLIGFGIYTILQVASDSAISTYSVRDIIKYSGVRFFGPLGIWFILIGILTYRTPDVNIYYHPTRLTKILSGIYRFLGIALVRAGLWNFSLIGTDDLSFLKILYVGGTITLCGILYILLGRLLYNTKNKIHLGFSMLCALTLNTMFIRIFNSFSNNDYGYGIDDYILINSPTLIYFSILTIRWIIKCRKFYKKGIINSKYLDSAPSKKKVGIITTIILLSIVIVNLIYGKIQWSKIPDVDESIFNRTEHQTKLLDEEDAIIQLKVFDNWYIDTASIFSPLDSYYLYEGNSSYYSENTNIGREQHTDECIIVNSGGNEYCGTWAWNKKTLERFLNNYYYIGYDDYMKEFINTDGYLSINNKKVTILEYLDKNEPEIRANLQKLNKIVSLDYNLNFPSSRDDPYYLLPSFLQGYTRASMIIIQYYTLKKDWEMVEFIVKLNYKMVDILNNYGSTVPHLISFVLQNITDSNINSLIKLFPKDLRIQLSERYSNLDYDKERMTKERTKGEYDIIWNRAKDAIFTDIGNNKPSLTQFMFHFPFFSKKNTNRFMDYAYYNLMYDENLDFDNYLIQSNLPEYSLYNYYGTYPYLVLRPRTSSYNNRLKHTIFHKQALIDNLKTGKYQTWFNELEWNDNPVNYEDNRLQTDEKLAN